jgi:sugar phosphate permease
LVANLAFAAGIFVAGWWSDKTSPRLVLAVGSGAVAVLGLGFGAGLGSGSLVGVAVTLSLSLFVMGLVYGPLGAWLPSLFSVSVRYTGISLAFNIGGIIGGAVAPFAAQWLAAHGGVAYVGLFLTVAGAITLVGVLASRPADVVRNLVLVD